MWGGDACVALAGGEAFTHETRTRATHNTSRPMRTNFRVERRTARTTQYWCKPLHRLDGPIRRIVGAIPCGQYHFKEETISLCHPERSEGSPSSERSKARAQDDTPASAAFDSQHVFFEMYWPLWSPACLSTATAPHLPAAKKPQPHPTPLLPSRVCIW